jgi:Nif-specific regulatory protein
MLLAYSFPGNVRELENIIERSVILSEDNVIHGYDLPLYLQTPILSDGKMMKKGLTIKLESVEYEMIIDALTNNKGNISAAADELGLTRRMLGLRMEKFAIDHKKYKG